MTSPLILVTGATGYIASRLIPRLLDSGYRVRALARNPLRLRPRTWFDRIDLIQADVTSPTSLAYVFDGVDTAYYLIHNMSRGHGYTSLELDAARNFARAAEQTNIKHIIYLGGPADPEQHIAPHSIHHDHVILRYGDQHVIRILRNQVEENDHVSAADVDNGDSPPSKGG